MLTLRILKICIRKKSRGFFFAVLLLLGCLPLVRDDISHSFTDSQFASIFFLLRDATDIVADDNDVTTVMTLTVVVVVAVVVYGEWQAQHFRR